MEGKLRVTPEKLRGTAGEFGSTNGQIQSITSEMNSIIQSLKGVWTGEASDAYSNKFNQLNDDMEKIHRMINEHVTDLNEMATQYETAERESEELANGLAGDVIN